MISEVKRLLQPDGLLVTSHFCWLPRRDSVAYASEQLVLRYNPNWTRSGLDRQDSVHAEMVRGPLRVARNAGV